jgi:hypothetical protein
VCSATDFGAMSNLAVALKMASLRLAAKGLRIGQIGSTNLREGLGSHIKPCGLSWFDNQYAGALGRRPTD